MVMVAYEVTATSGTVQVAIETTALKNPKSARDGRSQICLRNDGKPAPKYVAIPSKYESPEKSGLTYELEPGENTINIELTD